MYNSELPLGKYIFLTIIRMQTQGAYLDDGGDGLLLPKRFLPINAKIGDDVKVLIYHDKEGMLIATTQEAYGEVGDVVLLKCISTTEKGAYLDMGIMKDLYLPLALQSEHILEDESYLVQIIIDKSSSRLIATQAIDHLFQNKRIEYKENQKVEILVYRKTHLGFVVIINMMHLGLVYHNEIFKEINIGDKKTAFIKKINEEGKIDVSLTKLGLEKVDDASETIIKLLQENKGVLAFHDKSSTEEIYSFFGMSKKTFKKTIGVLYKNGDIILKDNSIEIVNTD